MLLVTACSPYQNLFPIPTDNFTNVIRDLCPKKRVTSIEG
jgi:hypothetical protein